LHRTIRIETLCCSNPGRSRISSHLFRYLKHALTECGSRDCYTYPVRRGDGVSATSAPKDPRRSGKENVGGTRLRRKLITGRTSVRRNSSYPRMRVNLHNGAIGLHLVYFGLHYEPRYHGRKATVEISTYETATTNSFRTCQIRSQSCKHRLPKFWQSLPRCYTRHRLSSRRIGRLLSPWDSLQPLRRPERIAR
jgi:hypothetical protein